MSDPAARNLLLYDGDCPFCSNYVQLMQLRKTIGPLDVLNMREHPDPGGAFRARGYDLNEGMLLQWDGKIYWAPTASTGWPCSAPVATCSTRSTPPSSASPACPKRCIPSCAPACNLGLTLMGKRQMQY